MLTTEFVHINHHTSCIRIEWKSSNGHLTKPVRSTFAIILYIFVAGVPMRVVKT